MSFWTCDAAEAAPTPGRPLPGPVQPAARKLQNPAGTAKAVAALARFAHGQLGTGAYDRRVAAVLGKQPGAKETARRLVQAIEAMPASERGKQFPGVKAETLTTSGFDRGAFEKSLGQWDIPAVANTTTLAPDPYNPQDKGQFELVYRGLKCDATGDPDGTDEPVVYVNVMSRNGGAYVSNPKYVPDSGTGTATAGSFVGAGAGQIWSSPTWPGGWNSGIVIITAVLEDAGDLAQRKQELDLLLQFAISETEEDTVTADRMEVLRREVEDALALLHLANPDRWSAKAVQVRKLTSPEYDQMYLQASTVQPAPHKLTAQHDPRGGNYTLFFDIPAPVVSYKKVYVKVKEVEALGADRDKFENKVADLGVNVSIDGYTSASATRKFGKNKNLVTPGWTVERDIQAGRTAAIHIDAFDDDPAPTCACTAAQGWPAQCTWYCASPEKAAQCYKDINYVGINPFLNYSGACPRAQIAYDINPKPDTGDGWFSASYRDVDFTYDLATNKLAGDVSGNPGTFTVVGTDQQGNKARLVFEVGSK